MRIVSRPVADRGRATVRRRVVACIAAAVACDAAGPAFAQRAGPTTAGGATESRRARQDDANRSETITAQVDAPAVGRNGAVIAPVVEAIGADATSRCSGRIPMAAVQDRRSVPACRSTRARRPLCAAPVRHMNVRRDGCRVDAASPRN
jgi:hypothetical protein